MKAARGRPSLGRRGEVRNNQSAAETAGKLTLSSGEPHMMCPRGDTAQALRGRVGRGGHHLGSEVSRDLGSSVECLVAGR